MVIEIATSPNIYKSLQQKDVIYMVSKNTLGVKKWCDQEKLPDATVTMVQTGDKFNVKHM